MIKKNSYPETRILKRYEEIVSAFPEVELKGAATPYTAVNGNMFSFLSEDGKLGLRLSEEDRNATLEKYETSLAESNGTVLKEYITVPEQVLDNDDKFRQFFQAALEYTRTLKPKRAKI